MMLWALVFITVNFVQGSLDVAVMDASKDPYLNLTEQLCKEKGAAIMAQNNNPNLHYVCLPVRK